MARRKCAVCARVGAVVDTVVRLSRNDYVRAYSVTCCRDCFAALDAMLEGQAHGWSAGVFSNAVKGNRRRANGA